jgi:iron complex outermembrane receptor protein
MHKRSQICLAALLAMGALSSHAQTPSDAPASPPTQLEKVLVTGSNIKRIDVETASPITILSKDDVLRQGVNSINELISNLSAATGGLSDINGSNSFAPGGTYNSLRNLGAQATLVLVNGRRMPSYALADYTTVFTNLDAIPLDAVERVEILKSGSSSIYGSDAVAGVINIITRKDFEGLDISADHTQSVTSGTFKTSQASITKGFGNYDRDGYNLLLNADFYKRDNVMWTHLLGYTNPELVAKSPPFGTYSTYSYPGNIVYGEGATPVAGCPSNLIIGGLCKYNRYDRFQAVPESQRANFYANGTLDVGGGTQAFAETLYSHIKTQYVGAFQYYGDGLGPIQWGNPTTGQPLTFNYLGLLASSPLNPTGEDGVGYRYRFVDSPSYQNVNSNEYRVLGGLRGTWHEKDWEVAAGLMNSTTSTDQRGAFSSAGFIKEIGDYNSFTADLNNVNLSYQTTDPNFFNQPNGYRPGQQNSASVIDTLFPHYGYAGSNTQEFVDAKLTGDAFAMPAGMAQFAVGGELRHETYKITPSANFMSGDIVGYGISSADSSRNSSAIYGELSMPLHKRVEMDAALRVDQYPHVAAHFSPKLALTVKAADSLKFRTSVESGFRAPNLIESAKSTKLAFDGGTSDPQRCPQATNLANDLYAQANALDPSSPQYPLLIARAESVQSAACSFGLADTVQNNPQLKPETSVGFNFGVIFEPLAGYTVTADYWNFDRKNTIGLASTQQLLSGAPIPAGTTVNRGPLTPNADPIFSAAEITTYGVTAGPLLSISREMENISEQKTNGIDVSVNTVTPLGWVGKLHIKSEATYLIGYHDSSITPVKENLVGQYAYPRWSGNLNLALERDTMAAGLRLNWASAQALQQGSTDTTWSIAGCAQQKLTAAQCRLDRFQTVDMFLSYSGIKHLSLTANLINMFGQRAPTDFKAFGVGGIIPTSLQDAQGRMLKLGLRYSFK